MYSYNIFGVPTSIVLVCSLLNFVIIYCVFLIQLIFISSKLTCLLFWTLFFHVSFRHLRSVMQCAFSSILNIFVFKVSFRFRCISFSVFVCLMSSGLSSFNIWKLLFFHLWFQFLTFFDCICLCICITFHNKIFPCHQVKMFYVRFFISIYVVGYLFILTYGRDTGKPLLCCEFVMLERRTFRFYALDVMAYSMFEAAIRWSFCF